MSAVYRPIRRDAAEPVHVQVRETLRDAILSGALAAGEKLLSEPELAEALGVSRMTANKAILSLVAEGWLERTKGRGTYVSEHPPRVRKSFAAIVAEDLDGAVENYYFGALYLELVHAAARAGYSLSLLDLDEVRRRPSQLGRLDGVVLINPPQRALEGLGGSLSHLPAVVLGATWWGGHWSCIDSDNVLGTGLAVSHLAGLGHRKLAFVGGCPHDSNTRDRRRGFRLACRLFGVEAVDEIPVSPEAVALSEEAIDAIDRVLRQADRPTALVVGGAVLALHAARAATERGLSLPRDLSLVAYDDPAFLAAFQPALTTVRQPLADMARVAFQELLRRCEAPNSEPSHLSCMPELVVRRSTGAPPDDTR
ncbi:MAG: GntR family transcriptional regulator [Fimbriimonadaceae bacterium]